MAIIAATLLLAAASGVTRPLDAQTSTSIFQATLAESNQGTGEVSTDELQRILRDRSATVFDARPPREYAISHIPGAINVVGKLGLPASQYVADAAEIERVLAANKSAAVVLYCSGPFCGRSKRLSEELVKAGFTNVRRYQVGIPVWRALGGPTQIELEGILHVHELDRSAVFVDARDGAEFLRGSIPRAVSVPASGLERGKDVGEMRRAKDDGRLPMEDHNTRLIVFGRDGTQARLVAEAISGEAFHNVTFYDGTFESLRGHIR